MIITVETGGYRQAADAFAGGNEMAALQCDVLGGKLAGFSAMAGSDSTSYEFSASYDAAAAEAVSTLADVAGAFATLGRLAAASAANHERAEASSAGRSPAEATLPSYAVVTAAAPPSSAGGRPPSFTSTQAWILSHVQGFVWPNADIGRLRAAAQTWRTHAQDLHTLADAGASAIAALDTQRSPEIPIAITATEDLRSTIGDLAVAFADLGAHCDAYADAVEAKHAEILALLHEIEMIVAEQLALGAVIGAVSFGIGAAAGVAGAVARIALEAPKFARIIESLRGMASATAASVRGTHEALQLRRLELERYLRVPARNERGAIALGNPRWGPGWLARHEHSGSHTLREHTGRIDHQLEERFSMSPSLRSASTFTDQDSAEWALERLLRRDERKIDAWLRGPESGLPLQGDVGRVVGRIMNRDQTVVPGQVVRAILVRDDSMPEGYRILTSYLVG